MSFLVDTNTWSEPGRTKPDKGVLDWFEAAPEDQIYLSVITLGELRRGTQLLPVGARRSAIEANHLVIQLQFADRILPIDDHVALTWGALSARHRQLGRSPSVSDELIAATALTWDLTVVTRNVADFEASGCRLLSPWSA